jgi:hypothetical protein
MARAGSTLNSNRPRSVWRLWSLMIWRIPCTSGTGLAIVGARVLQLGDRVRRPHVLFAADAEGVFAAGVEHVGQHRVAAEGVACRRSASSATSNTPMPSTFDGVP